METTRVSSRYQVVIPKGAREELAIEKGQEFAVLVKGGTLVFVPKRPVRELKGFVPGIDTDDYREEGDGE